MVFQLKLAADSDLWIHTARLDLEPLRGAHAALLYPVLSDPALYEFMGGSPPSSETALAEEYARLECRASPDGRDWWLNWLVRERETAAGIGFVEATVAPAHTRVAWVIGTGWQGRGYASDAARALVAWLECRGAPEIQACVHPRHVASQQVARRAGLRLTAGIVAGEQVWCRPPSAGKPGS